MNNDPVLIRGQILREIAHERDRQINVEGYTVGQDDKYVDDELARASAAYALGSSERPNRRERARTIFPWQDAQYKPKDRRRDLVRAAALAVAAIEQIDRAAVAGAPGAQGKVSQMQGN